ncbi:hypothetical protein ACQ4WX_10355 [Streptomyces lasalocidi]
MRRLVVILVVAAKAANTVEVFPMKRNGPSAVAAPVVSKSRPGGVDRARPGMTAAPPARLW